MSMQSLTLTAAQIDALDEALLLSLVDYRNARPDASYTAQWLEPSEGKIWDLPCYLLEVGTRVIMWSRTDEAGIEDVIVTDAEQDAAEQVEDYANQIAGGLGELQ
jgi:hypothetical protein